MGYINWTFPVTTNASGFAYIQFRNTNAVTERVGYYYNDTTCSATVIGGAPTKVGALGAYANLVRWNMEIQTNFTMADNTDFSMEIARVPYVGTSLDP